MFSNLFIIKNELLNLIDNELDNNKIYIINITYDYLLKKITWQDLMNEHNKRNKLIIIWSEIYKY